MSQEIPTIFSLLYCLISSVPPTKDRSNSPRNRASSSLTSCMLGQGRLISFHSHSKLRSLLPKPKKKVMIVKKMLKQGQFPNKAVVMQVKVRGLVTLAAKDMVPWVKVKAKVKIRRAKSFLNGVVS